MKIITRSRMRVVFHIGHTLIGFLVGYAVCLFVIADVDLGSKASILQRSRFFDETREICFFVGICSAVIFLIGSFFLVKIRYFKHLEKEERKGDQGTSSSEESSSEEEENASDQDESAAEPDEPEEQEVDQEEQEKENKE